jgi:hypothetical protein
MTATEGPTREKSYAGYPTLSEFVRVATYDSANRHANILFYFI